MGNILRICILQEPLFKHDVIRTSDITGERLWLLDEGHCFRDQLVRFCQMETVKVNQMAYHLGSMETFMRMVESGKGITFIPELAVSQLNEEQKKLVRPFAIPRPTRQIVLATSRILSVIACSMYSKKRFGSSTRNAIPAIHSVLTCCNIAYSCVIASGCMAFQPSPYFSSL